MVRQRLRELAAQRRRFSYRHLDILRTREGTRVNHSGCSEFTTRTGWRFAGGADASMLWARRRRWWCRSNAAFRQDQLDVAHAETEHVIQPHGMADDLGRKPMPRIPGGLKRFGETEVIKRVSFDVTDGEFVVFVGPSDCGKSTLLRLICGLESATEGDILIDGQRVKDLPTARRGLALVFQSYALRPCTDGALARRQRSSTRWAKPNAHAVHMDNAQR